MAKNLHQKPFDEETLVKLRLYRNYLSEWIPVFLAAKIRHFNTINIFDFFCGPGQDVNKEQGSPLIAVEKLNPYLTMLCATPDLMVHVYLNEFDHGKAVQLKRLFENEKYTEGPVQYHLYTKDFRVLFDELYPAMRRPKVANLIFLDQNGVKHITEDVFKRLANLKGTDFLFFISSSYFKRFKDQEVFQQYFPNLEEDLKSRRYFHIHRDVLNMYRSWRTSEGNPYLGQFTIKKGSNIYGLIFGSNHVLGIEKFLRSCWKEDKQRGEANFDIDDDRIQEDQKSLFEEMDKPKKLKVFEEDLKRDLLEGRLKTNHELYIFALVRGCLPMHASDAIKKTIAAKYIPKQSLPISYRAYKKEAIPIKRFD